MKKLSARLFLVTLVLLLTCGYAFGVDWNHDPDSAIGPNFWGELDPAFRTCGAVLEPDGPFVETGKKQSPIDIVKPTPAALLPLVFQYKRTPLVVENNGHAIEVPYEKGSILRIGQDTYELLQFHFHAPSEHTVADKSSDMEVHLVHRNFMGDLAVVGILINACDPKKDRRCDPNDLVELIFANAPDLAGEETVVGALINGKDLLPRFTSYYTYSGSLTTPPCTEGVRWLVLKDPIQVSAATVVKFHDIISKFPTYGGYPNDNRPVRPLNGRPVFERIGR